MMTWIYLVPVLVFICGTTLGNPTNLYPMSQEMIDYINSVQNSWKAGQNFHPNISMKYIKGLMGAKISDRRYPLLSHKNLIGKSSFTIPVSFDAREQWPNCPTIKEIRDQGSCGSCWAVAGAASISDRICIHSDGRLKPHISAEDMLSCIYEWFEGCNGGFIDDPWYYYFSSGVITGGNYNTSEGCEPYTIPECDHHINGTRPPCGETLPTPKCKPYCIAGYNKTYDQDKYFGHFIYIVDSNVENIQTEVMTNGPVEVGFTVYQDFLQYKSGVYHYIHGEILGAHAIKLLGWGTENNEDYWLLANSWNTDWGDNGFFKVRRNDSCLNIGAIASSIPIV
ncbi:hypothetical protein CHUAL_012490 [Chamberlinius hualienensis]